MCSCELNFKLCIIYEYGTDCANDPMYDFGCYLGQVNDTLSVLTCVLVMAVSRTLFIWKNVYNSVVSYTERQPFIPILVFLISFQGE